MSGRVGQTVEVLSARNFVGWGTPTSRHIWARRVASRLLNAAFALALVVGWCRLQLAAHDDR
jgi:hypothetical protein